MVFNCYETVTLKSIDLYAESSFSTQIEIIDVNENQIYSSTIALETGLNQVEIDFVIFPGNDYKIGINGSNDGLYRNSSVADGTFPVNLFDVIDYFKHDRRSLRLFLLFLQLAIGGCMSK